MKPMKNGKEDIRHSNRKGGRGGRQRQLRYQRTWQNVGNGSKLWKTQERNSAEDGGEERKKKASHEESLEEERQPLTLLENTKGSQCRKTWKHQPDDGNGALEEKKKEEEAEHWAEICGRLKTNSAELSLEGREALWKKEDLQPKALDEENFSVADAEKNGTSVNKRGGENLTLGRGEGRWNGGIFAGRRAGAAKKEGENKNIEISASRLWRSWDDGETAKKMTSKAAQKKYSKGYRENGGENAEKGENQDGAQVAHGRK